MKYFAFILLVSQLINSNSAALTYLELMYYSGKKSHWHLIHLCCSKLHHHYSSIVHKSTKTNWWTYALHTWDKCKEKTSHN